MALLAVVLAAFTLRVHELTRQDIWWDEARNIDVALRPFWHVANAPELDIHPPVYFWLLHFWGRLAALHVGDNPVPLAFLTRYLSVAAGVIGVALLYQLARKVARSPEAGLLAASVGVFSPFWLAESQETRMYALGFALLTAAALALLQITQSPITNRRSPLSRYRYRYHALFILLSALALLTHYNAVFILVAWYAWWGVWALAQADRWLRLRDVFLSGLAMTALVAPVAPIALRQIPGYANPNLTVPGMGDYLLQNWRAYLGGYAFDPALLRGYGNPWLWGAGILLGAGLVLAVVYAVRDRGARAWPLSFLIVWLLGGLALYYIAVLDRGAFNVRYSSFVTPALYALAGISLAALGRVWRPLTAIGLIALLIGLVAGVRADLYDSRFAREDISGVTTWLRAEAGPNDVIFVDQKYPFGFYYGRYAIDPDETPAGEEEAPARYLFVDINAIDQRLNEWARDAETVYWVQWFESDTDPRHAVNFLLDKAGERAGEQAFQGYTVEWWKMRPPNRFELNPDPVAATYRWPAAVETVTISLPQDPVAAGESIFAAIRWRLATQTPTERPLKARVALYDANDGRVAQSDERILNDRHLMPAQWRAEDRPLNAYELETPPDLPPGSYDIRLLVYDAETLEPLELEDEAGNPAGIEATIGQVRVE